MPRLVAASRHIHATLAAVALAACGGPAPPAGDGAEVEIELDTTPVVAAPVPREVLFDGIVEAVSESTVAPQTGGRIIELPYEVTGLAVEDLRAVVEIPPQHIAPLRRHRQARVIFDGESVETEDLRIPAKADPDTHSFRVLVNLPEGDYELLPGTLVKVAFVSGVEERLLVPAESVVRRGELTMVYVVDYEGNVGLRHIRTGTPTVDGAVPVLSGLHQPEQVALDPIAAGIAYESQQAVAQKSEE